MKHTPEQAAIIAAAKGNILVSAAAGSGKTAVLTDRIVQRIIMGQLNVQQMLVMTFTEAAARNMREKIQEKLQTALAAAQKPSERQWLSRQISLLPGAAISTIHAFCLNVIKNFYYCALDEKGQPLIEPGFGIDDGVESELLLLQALDEWMGSRYEAIDQAGDLPADDPGREQALEWQTAFYCLIEGYGDSSGDQPVRDLILRLHHFLRSLPEYPDFVREKLAELQAAAADFSAGAHQRELLRMLRLRLDRALSRLDELQDLLDGEIRFHSQPERNLAYCQQFQAAILTLRQLDRYLADGGHDWDSIRNMACGLQALELPRASRSEDIAKKQFMDTFCQYVAETVYFLSGNCGTPKCSENFIFDTRWIFCLPAADIEADISAMLPAVNLLFELVLGLDRQYTLRKRAAGMIDFSDFEHLALAILQQEEARQYYRTRYLEVYVDEYQDTSSIQEAIIQAVSDGNCLMVGDIKQSIYRFRHARPRIFIERSESYQNGGGGCLHELNLNFRSVAGILSAANELFRQLMSRGAGEIDYDDKQALRAFRPDDPDRHTPVHLLLVNRLPGGPAAGEADDEPEGADQSGDTIPQDELSGYQQEALAVVRQMLELHGQGRAWKDMAVLSRTKAISKACQNQLENYGIPVLADADGSFLDTPVMRQMEALIHVIDNIRQDIPLAAVLRAGICQGGLSGEEMAAIRLHARQSHPDCVFYHEAVLSYGADGPDPALRRRLADILAWLDHIRDREQILSLGELIGLVFHETGWLDRLAAQPNGEEEISQLRQFQQWAEQFESRRPRGLHAFARYIESLRGRGTVESPFAAPDLNQDAVRLMTIHGSKGLEFPVVFLVGTNHRITARDRQDPILMSESLGIGMDFADPEAQIRFPTHLKLAMLEELKAAGMAEELRLLYVAMTRAMDQLYISGTVKIQPGQGDSRLAALLRQTRLHVPLQLPDYLVLSGRCYLEWLIMALARQPAVDLSWLETGDLPSGQAAGPQTGTDPQTVWQLEIFQADALQKELTACAGLPDLPDEKQSPSGDPASLLESYLTGSPDPEHEQMRQNLWQQIAAPYRFEQAARTPVKLTVSELKRQEQTSMANEEQAGGLQLAQLNSGRGLWPVAADPRGINLTLYDWRESEDGGEKSRDAELPAARLGTLLHSAFRYLDLPAARRQPDQEEIGRQLDAMRQAGIFTEEESAALQPHIPDIAAFVRSDLAGEITGALAGPRRPVYLEMPFTLAVPASQVYAGCGGLAPEDKVLVQGIIDCWYETADGAVLLDYKSDRLTAEPVSCQAELQQRYGLQLAYYARAIEAATGRKVTRRLIWLIRQGRLVELAFAEANR